MKLKDDLIRIIEHHQPDSILAVGRSTPLAELKPGQFSQVGSLDELNQQARHSLAYVSDCLEHLPLDEGRQILAALRDIHAEIVYVHAPLDDHHWHHRGFLELGYRQIEAYEDSGTKSGLFYFDIYQYKLTPDWLNSKFWANPERWDQWED